MKKFIACVLILVLCLSVFAACKPEEPAGENPMDKAKSYIRLMYKDSFYKTSADYTVVSGVAVDGVTYPIEWSVEIKSGSKDAVKVGAEDGNGKTLIDVNEENAEDTVYNLIATVKGDNGFTLSFEHMVPAVMDFSNASYEDIVNAAYELEDGAVMEGTFTLYGTITKIDTPWDDGYKNITVTITVAGLDDKPIMCYRLAGEGAKDLAVGDDITVTGVLKNYKGTIEFDAGCKLEGHGEIPVLSTEKILDIAYGLEDGQAMEMPVTLTGTITKVDTAWSDDYQNITVTIVMEGFDDKPVQCFRLSGDNAQYLIVGDIVTVSGTIKNYQGTVEFDAGCTLDKVVKLPKDANGLTQDQIVDAAYELTPGQALTPNVTVTGVITAINTPWDDGFGNITVTIQYGDKADKPIECYRMKGQGADGLKVGDTITVTGTIKNYNGKIEFDAGCTVSDIVGGNGGSNEQPKPTEPKPTEPKPTEPKPTEPKPTEPKPAGLQPITQPDVTKTYKLGVVQGNLGQTLFFKGEMSGFYFATTDDPSAAVDIKLEEVSGGYRMYFMVGSTKNYVDIVHAMGTDGREHDNIIFTTDPTCVFTWSNELKTFITHVGEEDLYIGTSSNYNTLSASKIKYAETSFVGGLFA